MRPAGPRIVLAVLAFFFPLWCHAAPPGDSPGGKFSVDYSPKSNVIRVEASDADLRELVGEMARKAGFRVIGSTPPDATVSIRKANRLDRMLFELLDGEGISFVFYYDNLKTGKVAEVVLLENDGEDGTSGIFPADGSDRISASEGSDAEDTGIETASDAERASVSPANSVGNLLKMADSKDPLVRSAALATLSLYREQDEAAVARIRVALSDPDQRVRSVVVGILATFLADLPETGGVLLLALSDPSAEVRQQALLALWEGRSPMVQDALRLGVRDEDPQIRMWANDISRNLAEDSGSTDPTP